MSDVLPPHTSDGHCPVCYGSCGSNSPWDEAHEPYRYGARDGYRDAVAVFEAQFFGGPTKDMVLAWFAEHEPSI